MGFGDWLSDLGGGIGSLFGGGGGGGDIGGGGMPAGYSTYGISEAPLAVGGFSEQGAAAPSGGGGFGNWLSGVGGGIKEGLSEAGGLAKQVMPFAQLGATGMGIYGGIKGQQQGAEQMKILKQQQEQQRQMAAPAASAGATLTGAGSQALMGGALPLQQEQAVAQFEAQIREQMRQYMAHIGMTDSTAMASMEAQINQQVAQYRQQVAQSLYGAGLQGIGTALGPSQAAGTTAAGVVGGTTGQLAGANSALARLLGQGA